MLGGRGVALGLRGPSINLTDLSRPKRFSTPSSHQYSRPNCARRATNSLTSPLKRGRSKLAQILDPHELGLDAMEKPKRPHPPSSAWNKTRRKRNPSKSSSQQGQLEEQVKRLIVKRAFNRRTFWIACRAIVLGSILVFGGTAMCTVSFYNDYFSMETVLMADNQTMTTPNPTTRHHFQSMKYIGAITMGVGAFVLMMACVTTLEGRDAQARLYQEEQAQLELDLEKTPLTQRNTVTKKHSNASAALPGPSVLKQSTTPNASKAESKSDSSKTGVDISYQTADLIAVPNAAESEVVQTAIPNTGGVVNRCFVRDDSKTASKPDTDSGPSGTTTTTLTWSKNGGPRCEMDVVCKYPSASCIDNLIRKPDERALLQRFLEDQSRLVQDRLNRRVQQNTDDAFRSASLDATNSQKIIRTDANRNYRSEELPSTKNVVSAEVHHPGDASPNLNRINDTNEDKKSVHSWQVPTNSHSYVTPIKSSPEIQKSSLLAPIITPDSFELFSPMSVSPDTPGSIMAQKAKSPLIRAPESPTGGSVSGSYVTVLDMEDEMRISMDCMNANRSSSTPLQQQRTYNTFSNSYSEWPSNIPNTPEHADPIGSKKLYDSVFLAENLRRRASSQHGDEMIGRNRSAQKMFSMDYAPLGGSLVFKGYEERRRSQEQTGVLKKEWKEMNANYLRNQQKL